MNLLKSKDELELGPEIPLINKGFTKIQKILSYENYSMKNNKVIDDHITK